VTERSSDIEFDFFEEPETQEATARPRPSRGGPRRPARPPTGFTPLLRLAGLIAFAIAILVFLVFWISKCQADSKKETYGEYIQKIGAVGTGSADVGRDFHALLTTPGLRQADLDEELTGLAERQEQLYSEAATNITPPGELREAHRAAVQALAFRLSGLRRLQDAFTQTASLQNANQAGERLAQQTRRLLASDVIWDDLFREGAESKLREQEITGVDVRDSNFLTETDLVTARGMAPIWQRIRGAATGGTPTGRHGNGIVSVRALPSAKVLDPNADENEIVASADLAFEVTMENSGEHQEVGVAVKLTIQQSPQPIVRTKTVASINPGERKTVIFRDLGQLVQFTQRIPLKVEVARVAGETNVTNNVETYQVLFTLTP
jgi:CARDB